MIFSTGPLVAVGLIKKSHGYKGALKVEKYREFNSQKKESVFILMDSKPVPFFIEEIRETAVQIIVKFVDVSSDDQARLLCGKEILINQETEEDKTELFLIGYKATTTDGIDFGEVKSLEKYPQQVLLTFSNHKAVIPLTEDFIEELNHDEKTLLLKLPDGLIEINS